MRLFLTVISVILISLASSCAPYPTASERKPAIMKFYGRFEAGVKNKDEAFFDNSISPKMLKNEYEEAKELFLSKDLRNMYEKTDDNEIWENISFESTKKTTKASIIIKNSKEPNNAYILIIISDMKKCEIESLFHIEQE